MFVEIFTHNEVETIERCKLRVPTAESDLEAVDEVRSEIFRDAMAADHKEFWSYANEYFYLTGIIERLRMNYGSSKPALVA